MSDIRGLQVAESFASKLDIQMTSPAGYGKLIEVMRNVPSSNVCAMGLTGLGKTAIPKQIARKREAPYIQLQIPQMAIEDFHIPTTALDTREYYDRRIPRHFKTVIDYVQRLKEENGGVFPDGRQPIVSVEELNRARDKHVTQAAFVLLGERRIGDHVLDDAIQLVVTMNPSGQSYSVNEFERDAAARRRLLLVGISPSFGDFIRYANEQKFHEKVLAHLEAQPTWFYGYEAALAGKQFPSPASWETVSDILKALEKHDVPLTDTITQVLVAGKIGDVAATAFLEFARDNTIVITPDEVLTGYLPESSVRARFKKEYLGEGQDEARFDRVDDLMLGTAIKVFSDLKLDPKRYSRQIALFMDDLPEEKFKLFVRNLAQQAQLGEENRKYMLKFNSLLNTETCFRNVAARLTRAEQKVQEEQQKSGFTP